MLINCRIAKVYDFNSDDLFTINYDWSADKKCPIVIISNDGKWATIVDPSEYFPGEMGTLHNFPSAKQWYDEKLFAHDEERHLPKEKLFIAAHYSTMKGYTGLMPGLSSILPVLDMVPNSSLIDYDQKIVYLGLLQYMKTMLSTVNTSLIIDFVLIFESDLLNCSWFAAKLISDSTRVLFGFGHKTFGNIVYNAEKLYDKCKKSRDWGNVTPAPPVELLLDKTLISMSKQYIKTMKTCPRNQYTDWSLYDYLSCVMAAHRLLPSRIIFNKHLRMLEKMEQLTIQLG